MSSIEVLLIDDGSTDWSGAICEEYAARDSRFKVYRHTNNKGLSAARNTGICKAVCEYVMFVDSDDCVHEHFVRDAWECAVRFQADVVIFGYEEFEGDRKIRSWKYPEIAEGIINQEQAISIFGYIVWHKLYRKELFNKVIFPESFFYEDIGTTHKLLHKAAKIYYLNNVLYYKYHRPGSITTLRTPKVIKDRFIMGLKRYRDLLAWNYPHEKLKLLLTDLCLMYCVRCNQYLYPVVSESRYSDPDYVFAMQVIRDVDEIPKELKWKRKILLVSAKFSPKLFEFVCWLWKEICRLSV